MKRIAAILCAALLLLAAGCGAAPEDTEQAADTAQTFETGASSVLVPEESASVEPEPAAEPDYADTLFDASYVHTIDIQTDAAAWSAFIQTCTNKEYICVDMVIDGERYENAAIRGKGNSSMQGSRSSGKYSFKVEFDHYVDGLYHGLDKLGLNNLISDSSCMRDYVVYRMMGEFGVPAPLCSYVFVTVNGEDWGFYLAVEAIEDSFLERNYGAEHGNLYKPDNLNNGGAGNMRGGNSGQDVKLMYIDDDPASYPNIFDSAKTDVSRKDQYRLIASLKKLSEQTELETAVDTQEMLRYLVVQSFICNGDSYNGSSAHNYYLYEDEGRLSMLPWDYNEAFGAFGNSGMANVVNNPIDTPLLNASISERPMVAWVFSDEAYIARYHALYQAFLEEFCYSGRLRETMEAARDMIGSYVERDPRSFTTYDAFLTAVESHLTFFELRAESVQGQLNGTIPSTSEGQAADASTLIDASALPSGGSGGMGGMGGMPGGRR